MCPRQLHLYQCPILSDIQGVKKIIWWISYCIFGGYTWTRGCSIFKSTIADVKLSKSKSLHHLSTHRVLLYGAQVVTQSCFHFKETKLSYLSSFGLCLVFPLKLLINGRVNLHIGLQAASWFFNPHAQSLRNKPILLQTVKHDTPWH